MNIAIIVFYVVIIGAMMYFMAIKPQKKEQKRQQELMDSMEIGDYVLTTSGFYGVLIDISEDDVIVEFGTTRIAVSQCRRRQLLRLRSHQTAHQQNN